MRKPRKRQIKRAFHKWKLKWLSQQREVDISELKEDKCDNDHDCEHCDWVECPN